MWPAPSSPGSRPSTWFARRHVWAGTWAALLDHAIGQNHGFAEAVQAPDSPLGAFAPRPVASDELSDAWQAWADRLVAAFAAAALDSEVLLAEFSPEVRVPIAAVVGSHLLDTVVHTWEIATALGEQFGRTS